MEEKVVNISHKLILDNRKDVYKRQEELTQILKAAGIRVKADVTDKSPGFKFAEQEMRGIPVRIECGPKDIESGQAVICLLYTSSCSSMYRLLYC